MHCRTRRDGSAAASPATTHCTRASPRKEAEEAPLVASSSGSETSTPSALSGLSAGETRFQVRRSTDSKMEAASPPSAPSPTTVTRRCAAL